MSGKQPYTITEILKTESSHKKDRTNSYRVVSEKLAYTMVVANIVSEYDQEIPQSQTADNPVTPRGRAAQPSRDTMKTN